MAEYEKIYFDEFQYSVFDLGEKITIANISDKYERDIMEISLAMSKWIQGLKTETKLQKEYIVRGNHRKGYPIMTIIPETKLDKAKESLQECYSFLFSIAKINSSSNAANVINGNVETLSKLKKKRLLLSEDVLQKEDHTIQAGPSSSSVSTTLASSSIKENNHQEEKIEKKPLKKITPNDFFKKKDISKEDSHSKQEDIHKKEANPKTKASPKKVTNKTEHSPEIGKKGKPHHVNKSSGKVTKNKNSIASFFTAKPTANTKLEQKDSNEGFNESNDETMKEKKLKKDEQKDSNESNDETMPEKKLKKNEEKTVPLDKDKEKENEKNTIEEEVVTRKKRPLEDSESKKNKQSRKKLKISTGRKRIQVVESSDDENLESEAHVVDELDNSMVSTIIENDKKEEKEEEKKKEEKVDGDLTYIDDEGFLVTVKGQTKVPPKQAGKSTVSSPLKKNDNFAKLDIMKPTKAATKQGSIRNFFMKK